MKTVRRLNIKDKSDYFFIDMININNFDPKLLLISEDTTFNSQSAMFEISYCDESNTPYVVFNDIERVFKKVALTNT